MPRPEYRLRKNLTATDIATVQAAPVRLPLDPAPEDFGKVAETNDGKRAATRELFKAAMRRPTLLR